MIPTVVIVGRPNVGKSTLFNRLVGRRAALVDDSPGVTRDRREGEARIGDLAFHVVDTAGLEEAFGDSLPARIRKQTERAVADADLVLLVIDARAGVTPLDEHFANWLRATGANVALVANKCEGRGGQAGLYEAYALGLGEPVPLSAEHGEGIHLLYDLIAPLAAAGEGERAGRAAGGREGESEEPGGPLMLAIAGRPNVGKSTLVNALVGEERLLTGPEAGITRDAIAVSWTYRGRDIALVDTAGLRRRSRVAGKIEKLSVGDSLNAIQFAHVVALVLDAEQMLERQDLTIARHVIDEGRALVIIVNKWDLVADRNAAMRELRERMDISLAQAKGVPVVALSAATGRGLDRLMPAVLGAYDQWNRRLPTAAINEWLAETTERHPPPLAANKRPIRLRYATQPKARPPTFVLFGNRPEDLPESYLRYLENSLRERFGLAGTPIRLHTRKGANPYAGKGAGRS